MATITGLTAERMLEIEAASVVDGDIISGNLILVRQDGSPIDAGPVVGPQGPQGEPGDTGPPGASGYHVGQIIEMSGGNPDPATLLLCDGSDYLKTAWPLLNTYYSNAGYPHGSTTTHFNVPDKRERVSIGASAGTAVGVTEGVTFANRSGRRTKHRHTPHQHTYQAGQVETYGTSDAPNVAILRAPNGASTTGSDGGSGVATDPLDGPAFLASNFYVRAA